MCLGSFSRQGHDVHLYAYEPQPDAPRGVRVLDANEIIPEKAIFRTRKGRGKGSFACFADLFRYKLLFDRGGWWVDTDVFCLHAFDFEAPYVLGAEDKPVANGVIKAPAGCELMRRTYEAARDYDYRTILWNELTDILTRNVIDLGLARYVLPSHIFSPIAFDEIPDCVRGQREFSIGSESYAVHLYNEMWRRNHLDKHDRYPEGSLYEWLRSQSGVEPASVEAESWADRWVKDLSRPLRLLLRGFR